MDDGAKSVRAVERAIDILMCFAERGPSLSVTDLQKALALSRPTLYRLLATLERKGLVRSLGEPQRFELDYRVVALASAWHANCDVARAAEPCIKALWEAVDETVALFVLAAGHTKLCVEELPSRQALTFTRGRGFVEPATVGASGRVILAFLPEAERDAALAAVADVRLRTRYRADCERVAREGYHVSEGEILDGAVAIAAPVRDRHGFAAGSICLFGPDTRLSGARRARCIAELCHAASSVSRALGWVAGVAPRPAVLAETGVSGVR